MPAKYKSKRAPSPLTFLGIGGLVAGMGILAVLPLTIVVTLLDIFTRYVFFWVFGAWIPWYAALLGALLGPVTTAVWSLLWLAHFIPSIVWPLFR